MATAALTKYKNMLENAHKATRRAREKAGEIYHTALIAGETSASAFAFGLWSGAIGSDKSKYELFGVPAPLLAAALLHGGAVMGVGRGMEDHFRALGNGALAAHMFGMGQQMGDRYHSTGKFTTQGEIPSLSPGSSRRGVGVTPADVASFADR